MTLPNFALFGYAGSGKDTVARYLVEHYGYTRIAFADALKEMALSISPLITPVYMGDGSFETYTLHEIVAADGWEDAKRFYPEVRRFLRSLGATMRDRDPDYWLDIAINKIHSAGPWNNPSPVVISDMRFKNEYFALELMSRDFTMVRVDRPSIDISVDPESGELIRNVTPDWNLVNDGDLSTLQYRTDLMMRADTTME